MNEDKTIPQGFGSGTPTDAPAEPQAPAPDKEGKDK